MTWSTRTSCARRPPGSWLRCGGFSRTTRRLDRRSGGSAPFVHERGHWGDCCPPLPRLSPLPTACRSACGGRRTPMSALDFAIRDGYPARWPPALAGAAPSGRVGPALEDAEAALLRAGEPGVGRRHNDLLVGRRRPVAGALLRRGKALEGSAGSRGESRHHGRGGPPASSARTPRPNCYAAAAPSACSTTSQPASVRTWRRSAARWSSASLSTPARWAGSRYELSVAGKHSSVRAWSLSLIHI